MVIIKTKNKKNGFCSYGIEKFRKGETFKGLRINKNGYAIVLIEGATRSHPNGYRYSLYREGLASYAEAERISLWRGRYE